MTHPIPKRVFRYLRSHEHALAFAAGTFRVSTLGHVRSDERTADAKDGVAIYRVTNSLAGAPQERDVIQARVGLPLDNIAIVNNEFVEEHPDAWVLCFSLHGNSPSLKRTFGDHVVQIVDPLSFFSATSAQLRMQVQLSSDEMGPVRYSGREYADAEPFPGAPFASTDAYSVEQEYRMFFRPRFSSSPIAPIDLHVPEVARLCTLR